MDCSFAAHTTATYLVPSFDETTGIITWIPVCDTHIITHEFSPSLPDVTYRPYVIETRPELKTDRSYVTVCGVTGCPVRARDVDEYHVHHNGSIYLPSEKELEALR